MSPSVISFTSPGLGGAAKTPSTAAWTFRTFFKVAVFLQGGKLAATGYVVDQTPQLADLPDVPRPGTTDDAPPLGPFRTFQVPIRDIGVLTGLDLGQLVAVDRMPIASELPSARELHSPEDLDFDLGT